MDRREFLKVGAAGASGLMILGGSSCASMPKLPPGSLRPLPMPDMDRYLAGVDAGMETISRWSPSSAFPSFAGDRAAVDALGRQSLRTLYMTAMFSDLPEEAQRHSGMQQRIVGAAPEMDEATSAMEGFLSAQSPQDLHRLQSVLRDPRNPGMEIIEALDRSAALCGLSDRRRLQTRVMMTHANWRLRNQPPSLVIGETLDKVRKAVATDVPQEARGDWVAGRVGERLFWQEQLRAEVVPHPFGEAKRDTTPGARHRIIHRGAKLLGIGIIVGGLSAAAATKQFGFIFVTTVGAVLILIGLITLLVGLLTPGDAR